MHKTQFDVQHVNLGFGKICDYPMLNCQNHDPDQCYAAVNRGWMDGAQ